MSNKKSVAKNYIYNLTYQIFTFFIPLITTPYLSRVLGAENIGIYSYTLSITTYFILFGSLGVAMYGQREIAYLQDNKKDRTITFFEILIMRFITLGLSLIAFYFVFCTSGEYQTYYTIFIIEIVASSLDVSWFFQGMEEFKKTITRNIMVKIISVISIFIFVKTQADLGLYIIIYVLSTFIGNVSLWLYLPKYIKKIRIKELHIFRHIKPTISLFIPQVAIQIYTVLDKTMIGTMVADKSEVGFYEQSQKIIKMLLTAAISIGTVMVPRMANTYAKGNKEKLRNYLLKSFNFVIMIAVPLTFGIISISAKFVPVFYGQGYDKVIMLINIISPIILIIGLSNVMGMQYLLPTKQQKKFTISVTCGAIINFLLNIVFISFWQSLGASIATVIAEVAVTGIQFYLLRDEIKVLEVIRISKNYFIASILMFIASCFVGNFITNNIISIIVQAGVGGIVFIITLLVLKDKFLTEILNKIFKRRKVNV